MAILTDGGGQDLVDNSSVALTDDDFAAPATGMGPLVVSADNPRYLARPDGTCIHFQGSHNWSNFQQWSLNSPASPLFDNTAHINYLLSAGATFIRGWMFENPAHIIGEAATVYFSPVPWSRTGPGNATDGLPKFDLTVFDQSYFDMLHQRAQALQDAGIYVSIMLFQGFSVNDSLPFSTHPFKASNNINSINAGPSDPRDTHTLVDSAVVALQEAYVTKLIDTVNDLDNIIYEISNEDSTASGPWQAHFISFIHTYEAGKAKQHPVWFTPPIDASPFPYSTLLASSAEVIGGSPSLSGGQDWVNNVLENNGTKVNVLDTDHIFGSLTASTSDVWTWKSFLRGNGVIHMESLQGLGITGAWTDANVIANLDPFNPYMRRAMTQTGGYAARIDLRFAIPHGLASANGALTSEGFCLAKPGSQYLVLAVSGGSITVNLSAGAGKRFSVEWLKISDSTVSTGSAVAGGSSSQSFTSPFSSSPSVLFLDDMDDLPPVAGPSIVPERPAYRSTLHNWIVGASLALTAPPPVVIPYMPCAVTAWPISDGPALFNRDWVNYLPPPHVVTVNPKPFTQVDQSNPRLGPVTLRDWTAQQVPVGGTAYAPCVAVAWPVAEAPPAGQSWTYSAIAVLTAPIPPRPPVPYDWTLPRTAAVAFDLRTWTQANETLLNTTPAARPPTRYDWPIPQQVVAPWRAVNWVAQGGALRTPPPGIKPPPSQLDQSNPRLGPLVLRDFAGEPYALRTPEAPPPPIVITPPPHYGGDWWHRHHPKPGRGEGKRCRFVTIDGVLTWICDRLEWERAATAREQALDLVYDAEGELEPLFEALRVEEATNASEAKRAAATLLMHAIHEAAIEDEDDDLLLLD